MTKDELREATLPWTPDERVGQGTTDVIIDYGEQDVRSWDIIFTALPTAKAEAVIKLHDKFVEVLLAIIGDEEAS